MMHWQEPQGDRMAELDKLIAPTREVKRKPQELCLGCGLPTGKGPRARRCEPCRKKHRNVRKFKPTLVRRSAARKT